MSVSAKKKKCKCACVLFKWPEVAACLLNHYQSHSPPSVTSPVSEGILVSACTPWTRTRSSEPERGKKSFLRSSPQIYCIPWRGSRPVSPCFNLAPSRRQRGIHGALQCAKENFNSLKTGCKKGCTVIRSCCLQQRTPPCSALCPVQPCVLTQH